MRILVCPQEFKGTLTVAEAADAIATGVGRAYPGAEVVRLPLSDGGPGFVDALAVATAGRRVEVQVRDALLRPRRAEFLLAAGDVFVESAAANGLVWVAERERDPLRASTEGVGDLLRAAAAESPARIVVGVGGSATNDGGSGMARALGARFLDEDGADLPPGGSALARLAEIRWDLPAAFRDIEVVIATDVTSPLLGPDGATHVFGPQKGADEAAIETLEAALVRYAAVLHTCLGADVRDVPGAGAAGGLAAGLLAFLGASIEPGFDIVANAVGLEPAVRQADVVVTGEGRYDSQSARGKVTGRVLDMARRHGKPVYVVAGSAEPEPAVVSVVETCGEAAAFDDPQAAVAAAAATVQLPPSPR